MEIGLLLLFLYERFERNKWRSGSRLRPQRRLELLKGRIVVLTFGEYFHRGHTLREAKSLFAARIWNVRIIFRVRLIA